MGLTRFDCAIHEVDSRRSVDISERLRYLLVLPIELKLKDASRTGNLELVEKAMEEQLSAKLLL
jgi:hypothetical protein